MTTLPWCGLGHGMRTGLRMWLHTPAFPMQSGRRGTPMSRSMVSSSTSGWSSVAPTHRDGVGFARTRSGRRCTFGSVSMCRLCCSLSRSLCYQLSLSHYDVSVLFCRPDESCYIRIYDGLSIKTPISSVLHEKYPVPGLPTDLSNF